MKKLFAILFICTLTLSFLKGQEEAIPFDTKGNVWVIDKETNKTYKLFKEEDNVIEARLFSINDSNIILEKLVNKDNKTIRDKQTLSLVELKMLRNKVDSSAMLIVNQEGRSWFLGVTTIAGLLGYGPSVPIILNSSDSKTFVSSYMFTASACFFLPWYLTRDKPFTYSHLNLTTYGLSSGFIHGIQIASALKANDIQSFYAMGVTTGIAESFIGYHLVNKLNISYGQAQLMTSYANMGLLIGYAADVQFEIDADNSATAFQCMSLLGTSVGMGIGYYQGLDRSITAGDAHVINTCAYLGAFLPVGVLIDMEPEDLKVVTTTLSLSSICGAMVGSHITKNTNFTYGQSLMISLGTLAGGLTGLGLGYLANDNSASFITYTSELSALATFGLMFDYYRKSPETSENNKRFNLNFFPQNLLAWKQGKINPIYMQNLPLVSLSTTF